MQTVVLGPHPSASLWEPAPSAPPWELGTSVGGSEEPSLRGWSEGVTSPAPDCELIFGGLIKGKVDFNIKGAFRVPTEFGQFYDHFSSSLLCPLPDMVLWATQKGWEAWKPSWLLLGCSSTNLTPISNHTAAECILANIKATLLLFQITFCNHYSLWQYMSEAASCLDWWQPAENEGALGLSLPPWGRTRD